MRVAVWRAPAENSCRATFRDENLTEYLCFIRRRRFRPLSGRADLMAFRTSFWWPDVRVSLDEDGEVEGTERGREELTKKGTKRKRAPPTNGPCEHGVKYRSQCKVCSACPHGRQRSQCKECGGSSICEHGRQRSTCKECGGSQICEHGRIRSSCKECGGASICEHGRVRSCLLYTSPSPRDRQKSRMPSSA